MGRADHAHVHRDLPAPADALDDPLLEEPQKLGLERHGQVPNLVEKEDAAVGGLDLSGVVLPAPVKAPFS
jgi:hypothetical protein